MRIGIAVSDITPELGIYLTGYGQPERLATGIHSPLTATALVMKDAKQEAAIISLDWCYMDDRVALDIRQGVSAASGLPVEHIVVCCTHTHSAPHTCSRRTRGRTAVDPENKGLAYVRKVIPAIADAVCRAMASAHEAEAGFARGLTETGVSRRGTDENGKISTFFIGDPDAVADKNMTTVLFRDRETHEAIGILIHCSAHNTCMGLDRNISSDWCGAMRTRMASRYPVPIMFLNGSFGDMGPRTNRWIENMGIHGFGAGAGDGPSSVAEVGTRAATDALRLLEGIRDFNAELPLRISVQTLSLPQAIPVSEAEAAEIVRQYEAPGEKNGEPPVKYQVAKAALEAYQQPPQPELRFEQILISCGPLAFAPYPFEIFSVFSLRLRKYSPYQHTLLCSNANGCYAYLPDRGAIACGGYEVECRKLSRPYVTTPEAGDLAITQTLQNLRTL